MARTTLKEAVTGTGTAVAPSNPADTLAHLLAKPAIKAQMMLALPKHMTADRLTRIATTELRNNPKLAKCSQASFLGAIMQLAALGLEPGGALGHAYLIPFEKSKKDETGAWRKVMEVQVVIGYRGMIDIARRSGQIVSLSARVVHERDTFSYTYGLDETLEHKPYEGAEDPGPVTHAYAVAKLVGGGVQFEVMSLAQICRIRDNSQGYKAAAASAKSYNKPIDSPWENNFEEMARKSPTRNLFKWLPVSIEIQRAVGLDERADAGISQNNRNFIDGTFSEIDDQGTVEAPAGDEPQRVATDPDFTAQEVHDAIANAKDRDSLDLAADLIRMLPEADQPALSALYDTRALEIVGGE